MTSLETTIIRTWILARNLVLLIIGIFRVMGEPTVIPLVYFGIYGENFSSEKNLMRLTASCFNKHKQITAGKSFELGGLREHLADLENVGDIFEILFSGRTINSLTSKMETNFWSEILGYFKIMSWTLWTISEVLVDFSLICIFLGVEESFSDSAYLFAMMYTIDLEYPKNFIISIGVLLKVWRLPIIAACIPRLAWQVQTFWSQESLIDISI